uniref:Mlh3, MGC80774 n=1 Tax=Arundo donax TaxID=35708 RepID=A0A0A9F1F6_ARUDO
MYKYWKSFVHNKFVGADICPERTQSWSEATIS